MHGRSLSAGLLLGAVALTLPTRAEEPPGVYIIFDASGSMWGQLPDGNHKIQVAREVLRDFAGWDFGDRELALRAYDPDEPTEGGLSAMDAAALVAEAQELADDGSRAFVDAVAAEVSERARGDVNGPGCYPARYVGPSGSTSWFDIGLYGGEYAGIRVEAFRGSDIDCWLFDENENLIDSDTDSTSVCLLEVVPNWTGLFYVKIHNYSGPGTNFEICTN